MGDILVPNGLSRGCRVFERAGLVVEALEPAFLVTTKLRIRDGRFHAADGLVVDLDGTGQGWRSLPQCASELGRGNDNVPYTTLATIAGERTTA
jgi:hypothetical protein